MEDGVLLDRGLGLRTVSEFEARSLEFQLQNHHHQQQQHHQQGICVLSQDSKPRNQISSSGFFCYSDFSSTPTPIPQQLDQVHSFESSSSSSQMVVNHHEIFNLQNGMELLGFKNLQQTLSNRDSTMTPKYTPNPLDNRNSSAGFWKGLAGNQRKSDHGSYQPQFDHSPIQKHDFSGGFSDLATHTSSNELSRGSETPKFPIEIPLQIDASQPNQTQSLIVEPETAWQQNRFSLSWANRFQSEEKEDDSSLRCVFPCEGNQRPSQGLSLSLSPHKPCNIRLQSFELREAHSRDGFFGRSSNQFLQDGRPMLSSSSSSCFQPQQLKNSRYLAPAQELLNEFCNLETKQTITSSSTKSKFQKTSNWDGPLSCRNSDGTNQSFFCTDALELQKRIANLVSMLEEVDRRYKQYSQQMRAVVSSFEAVAGNGAANVYSALASKAMSKHFRCLRNAIVGQIQATKMAMGEKHPVAPGTTRGETPRLKLLDQSLRQQRAFQQMGTMENHPWRPQRGLPERSVSVLRAWLFEHFLHPYPSDVDKHILARQTGLSRSQVSNWFINARVRLWKPMVEEMYLEESKAQDKAGDDDVGLENGLLNQQSDPNPNPNPSSHATTLQGSSDDHKPTPQPHLNDSESLASIVNSETRLPGKGKTQQQEQFGRSEPFGVADLDFSSYNNTASTVTYSNEDSGGLRNFNNGVSLTLGLQHSGSGVSLSFSPASQHSLFFTRDHIDECQPVEYAILDGAESHGNSSFESQALPYRNLVGAHLHHDFAG